MKISVVIPTYNRKQALFRAIDSVIAQTRDAAEIIVVDDGSTDGTSEAIAGLDAPTVRLVKQKNAGASAARNRGIREAKAEWIAFLDSDDTWLPEKLQRQCEALKTFGCESGLCFTDNSFSGNRDMQCTRFQQVGFTDPPQMGVLEKPTEMILDHREPFYTSSLLIRRSLLRELGGFNESLIVREDTDLVFRMSLRTRFCYVRDTLVQVDRTPSRTDGLCDLYARRDDRVFESVKLLYANWLAMPEVRGTEYEPQVQSLLRRVQYDSLEAKLHDFRAKAALNEIARMKQSREGYLSIISTLAARKLAKMRRTLPVSVLPPPKEE